MSVLLLPSLRHPMVVEFRSNLRKHLCFHSLWLVNKVRCQELLGRREFLKAGQPLMSAAGVSAVKTETQACWRHSQVANSK